ncbi:MAG: hypothetical protein EBW68_06265 [Actinobacteria bacterium]|jgi:hypothetical protein|nr:hypothetical protein [Actinomycetota bacterium]
MYNKKEKPIVLEVDRIYQIEGKKYLIDENAYNKTYVWLVDDGNEPYGRRRTLGGIKNKEVIKLT